MICTSLAQAIHLIKSLFQQPARYSVLTSSERWIARPASAGSRSLSWVINMAEYSSSISNHTSSGFFCVEQPGEKTLDRRPRTSREATSARYRRAALPHHFLLVEMYCSRREDAFCVLGTSKHVLGELIWHTRRCTLRRRLCEHRLRKDVPKLFP